MEKKQHHHEDRNEQKHQHSHENNQEHKHEHNHEHKHESHDHHSHTHTHAHGHSHGHSHEHSHHHHHHSHTHTKAVVNRLARAIGHLESVKRMVEDGKDCSEVLVQLSAVKSALNNTGKLILKDHIEHCIIDAVEHGDQKAIEDLNNAIERFFK